VGRSPFITVAPFVISAVLATRRWCGHCGGSWLFRVGLRRSETRDKVPVSQVFEFRRLVNAPIAALRATRVEGATVVVGIYGVDGINSINVINAINNALPNGRYAP